MEFKINKIEMDVRQKINQEVSTDKVHTKKEIQVNKDRESTKDSVKDSKKNQKHDNEYNDETSNEAKDKRDEEKNCEVRGQDPNRGHFIDIKR